MDKDTVDIQISYPKYLGKIHCCITTFYQDGEKVGRYIVQRDTLVKYLQKNFINLI